MDVEGTIFKATFKLHGVDYKSTLWQPIARELGDAAMDEENNMAQKYEQSITVAWDNFKWPNIHTMGAPTRGEKLRLA